MFSVSKELRALSQELGQKSCALAQSPSPANFHLEDEPGLRNLLLIIDLDAQPAGRTKLNTLNNLIDIGNVEALQILFKNAYVENINREVRGRSAFYRAAQKWKTPIVNLLLSHERLDIDDKAIRLMLQEGQTEYLKLAVSCGKINPGEWRSKGERQTLLHEALLWPNRSVTYIQHPRGVRPPLDMLELIISYAESHGLDPNVKDVHGWTALHQAVFGLSETGVQARLLLLPALIDSHPQFQLEK